VKVFLTGGTGFIGQPLTKALLRRGWGVTALVRRPTSAEAQAIAAAGAQLLPGDVTDRESMRGGMTGAEIVVHNAGVYDIGADKAGQAMMRAVNIDGTENVLSLAHKLGARHVVYVSSVVYYGDTGKTLRDETFQPTSSYPSYYEWSKAEAHKIAEGYQARGLPLVTVCPGTVIGPNDYSGWGYFARLYVNGWMPPFAWGRDTIMVSVHVEDVAEGVALAAERGKAGESYLLTGDPGTIGETLAIWAQTPGGFRVRAYLPIWLMAALVAPLEPLQRRLGMAAFLSRETVRSSAIDRYFTNAKARRDLGWTPRSVREAWPEILAAERALRAYRTRRNLPSLLKPLPAELLPGKLP
jgi:dihydroflavonol-4-reductase